MRYGVLGPVELVTAEGAEPVRGSRQRALLAVLLAHRGALVPRERLIAALWPTGPPPSAEHTLHSHASRIRALVGADLRAVPGGYRLDPQDLDADRFDRAVRAATRPRTVGRGRPDAEADEPAGRAQVLTDALALWRGPAFGGEADMPEVQAEAERLETARRSAHEALARALLGTDPERAADAAERALEGDPYREGAWALLVRARTAEGRPGDAVLSYLRAAAALDEIGLLPSHELRTAHAAALAAGRPRGAGVPAGGGGSRDTGEPRGVRTAAERADEGAAPLRADGHARSPGPGRTGTRPTADALPVPGRPAAAGAPRRAATPPAGRTARPAPDRRPATRCPAQTPRRPPRAQRCRAPARPSSAARTSCAPPAPCSGRAPW